MFFVREQLAWYASGEPIDRVVPGMVVGQRVAVVAGAGLEHVREVSVDLPRDEVGGAARCFALGQVAPARFATDLGRFLFRCAEPIGKRVVLTPIASTTEPTSKKPITNASATWTTLS